ncbi:histidine phosphatase family protein [Paenibacillus sp. FA6]|uniref:histidine phosphatase family protein n=1 Tax=Paenibacillus sp. FA6 TaxID=3413029 RepID=UPI003F654CF0
MQIFLIRHADPDYAIDNLTEFGHQEAAALGKRMASIGLDELYASPLGRAQTTASYIAQETGLAIQTEAWTSELDWSEVMIEDQMGSIWDYPGEHIPEVFSGKRTWDDKTDHWLMQEEYRTGYSDLQVASDEFLLRHHYTREKGLYRMKQPSTKKIAMVCHNGFGLAWLSHLLQIPLSLAWSVLWLAPSSVTTILFEERSQHLAVPRCTAMGDTSHLYANGMNYQPRGLLGNHI